jgi:hypothetical protein
LFDPRITYAKSGVLRPYAAEKARKQKLVEAADLEAAKELFGDDGEVGGLRSR